VISYDELYNLISEINDTHNFHLNINLYSKVPADITIDDVKKMNLKKKLHNDIVDTRDIFELGDLVKVQLLKDDKLDKART